MSVDYARFVAELAEKYYNKARQKNLFCTASLDEVRMAYAALTELERQGIYDPRTVKVIIKSALVKDPECADPFEDAWSEVVGGGR